MKNKDYQEISRKDLAAIYKSEICKGWKEKVAEVLIEQVDSKTIEVSNELINSAYKEANDGQKKLISKYFDIVIPKKITDRIQTLDDIYKLNNVDDSILPFKKANNDYQRYLNACALIPLIVKAYNEGKELDWPNNSSKYLPYYKYVSGQGWVYDYCYGWDSCSYGSSSHHYNNLDNLYDGTKKFNQVYVDFFSYKG
jgi:hypothetical protein